MAIIGFVENNRVRSLPCAARGLALLLLAAPLARAQLSIEITGAGAQRIPIAVVPFAGEGALAQSISAVVRADLERSGLFRGLEVPPLSPHPTEASRVNYADWRSRLADALVLGSVAARPDGRFEVRFRLFDAVKQQRPERRRLHAVARTSCAPPRTASPTSSTRS